MAQQQGVDYSFSRPSPASIVAAGYTFVMRYLASSASKRISGAEATALHAVGLTIGFVFEDFADPLTNNPGLSDYNGGVADATLAVGQTNALGVPANRPIYVAVDIGQFVGREARYQQYFRGWSDTIGVGRVGFYGGGDLWTYLFPTFASGYFWEASAYSWSSYKITYPGAIMLQNLGAVLGGTSDSNTAYVVDFGQWPEPTQTASPPPVHSGATFVANVSNDGNYSQPSKQSLLTPTESHDQVIYSVTTSDATLSTGSHLSFYEIPTTIAQYGYPIGTFSYDGGISFNDFGFQLPITPGGTGIYPAVTLQPVVDASGNIFFNGVNNSGGTVSLIINVALLATENPKSLPKGAQILGEGTSYTNIFPKLTGDETTRVYSSYRRIAIDSDVVGNSVTVGHGQSSIPNIMFWVSIGGKITINPVGWQSGGAGGDLGIRMDANNLYFHVNSATYDKAYYRVYKDN